MRHSLVSFAFASALLSLAACTTETAEPGSDPESATIPTQTRRPTGSSADRGTSTSSNGSRQDEDPGPTVDAELSEVVYVLMQTRGGNASWCSGTLVASDKVVTAGHCLAGMKNFEVIAPFAADEPRVTASSQKIFGADPEAVEQPDIGILTLDTPITLPAYGELTDVVAQVEAKQTTNGIVMLRTSRDPQSSLKLSATLPVSSTVDEGYVHGFGTPLFSGPGDSGAGMFLVHPNGRRTHTLIAVVRNPEPARDVDHQTRIDADFLTWYAANK